MSTNTCLIAMGPFGSSIKVETFVPQGVPVISGQHLRGTRLSDLDYNFVSVEHAEKLSKANVRRGDVVFTHAGNIGQVAYIPKSSKYERYVISQRQFYLRPNTTKALPEFIAYYFTSAEGQHKLLANASSSGVPSLAQPVSYLRTVEIPLPPLAEQRAIAKILGTLDDKVEMNRRMNQTLEAITRSLFKSWFVDFDPVRAKAEGRDPCLPKALTDLLPDSFEDSELGEIPKGWRVGSVSDLCTAIYSGGTPSTQNPDYWDGNILWLSSGETREKFITDTERRITPAGVSNSSTRLAPALSTVIASAGQGNTRGQTSLLTIASYVNQSVVVLTADSKTCSPCHLFLTWNAATSNSGKFQTHIVHAAA